MKAAVLDAVDQITLRMVQRPALLPGDMLLRVRAATICGTDIRILRGKKTAGVRYPSILGHEFSGEVVETGGHTQFSAGQAVTVCPAFGCGHCDSCKGGAENLCRNQIAMGYQLDGAFAEYVRIPALAVASGNVFAMPAAMDFAQAALAEPLACVINGQQQARVGLGDVVVVLGAGPIGILHVKLAKLSGAARVIVSQTSASRRAAALAAGADVVIDPHTENVVERVHALTSGIGADVVICAIGKPDLAQDAIRMARPRGRVNLFAGFTKGVTANLDVNAIHYNELVVTGAFGLTRLQFETALGMIATGRLETASIITHRYGLSDMPQALATAEQGSAIKVAIINE